jgi:hypothetical protein
MLWLVSGPADHGMILAGPHAWVDAVSSVRADRSEIDTERFESFQGSQPDRSPRADFRVCENRRCSGGLGSCGRVSGRQFPEFRVLDRWVTGPSLCSPFSNFRFGVPQTGSICGRDWFADPRASAHSRQRATEVDQFWAAPPSLLRSPLGLASRASPVHTVVRNCTRDEGRPFLRQDKSRKGE